MARQSATNPRFRCNVCKDYYSAPEHTVHYQCASHGYLCDKHLIKDGDEEDDAKKKSSTEPEDGFAIRWDDGGVTFIGYSIKVQKPGRLGYDYETVLIPKKYKGKCALVEKGQTLYNKGHIEKMEWLKGSICLNTTVKFNWHQDVGRWIEEGREKEEKAKAKPKAKSKTKPDYVKEIKVLVDLLEDDTLTKEVFIKKIREKLK